jgi:DNA-binding response OmpR family regulator
MAELVPCTFLALIGGPVETEGPPGDTTRAWSPAYATQHWTVEEGLPDCIAADVMMPRRDGFQMCRALRRDAMTEGIPVILLTARAEAADEAEGLRSGADAYLTKPFDAEVLWTQVGNLIAQRHRLRERVRAEMNDPPESESPAGAQPSPFEQEVRTAIRAHLSDPDFTVARLVEEVALSRSQLYRRTKRATDQSPNALIRRMRLETAAQLLRDGEGSVSEVAYAVGFESLSYFSRRFREHAGAAPSTLLPDDG